jgi:hypothetical protein
MPIGSRLCGQVAVQDVCMNIKLSCFSQLQYLRTGIKRFKDCATEASRLREVTGFANNRAHDERRLLGCYAVWLL